MNFRPLHDRVLVRRVQSDEKTPGGIIIPDTAQEKPMEGEVLEVGSGARDENGKLVPLDVKKDLGDRDHVLEVEQPPRIHLQRQRQHRE